MTNNKSILKQFAEFVSIQSVSTDKNRNNEILKAVEFLKREIKSLGFQVNIYQKNGCPPLIIAKKIVSQNTRTIGIYAHYDVQPEDPIRQWKSPPFKLTQKNGKLFGRGVADDKGHIIQTLIAINQLIDAKKLNNNIILIFEGEEEVGSQNFEKLINQAKKDLEIINVFYVLDMGMKEKNIPQIYYGLRGIVAFELKIKTSETDLHSGVFGNQVSNPAQLISELMSKIKNSQTRKIKIPGFYDQVKKITTDETNLLLKVNDSLSSKIYPSLDINGMVSGYTGEGSKMIIPAEALVKFSIRLVPSQNHKEVEKIVKKFIKNNLPKEVNYELKIMAGSDPFYTDYRNSYVKKTADILKNIFKKEVDYNRSGASIGAAEILQRLFEKPIILTGFTLADCAIHSPNENYDEELFFKGIVSLEKIFAQ